MATKRGEAVYASMHSDKARDMLRAIMAGEVDEDLDVIERNARLRARTAAKRAFPLGSRVRLHGTRNPNYEGREGTVVKINPTRLLVWFDEDHAEWMGPLERMTLAEKASYASLGVPPSMLQRA